MEKTQFMKLGVRDAVRGVTIAVLTPILFSVLGTLQAGALPGLDDLKTVGIAGLAAGLAYVINNFFTNSKGNYGAEPKDQPTS